MQFQICSVRHTVGAVFPLTVRLKVNDRDRKVRLSAKQLQTFAAFQATVADRVGLWLTDPHSGQRDAGEAWQANIAEAFARSEKMEG